MTDPALATFVRAAVALEPYLSKLVVVGGWAHRLHHEHPRARPPEFEPLFTEDADLAAPPDLEPIGDTMGERLRSAGFSQRFLGDDTPPITHFHLGDEQSGFYLEFLTWRRGTGRKRGGVAEDRAKIAGVTAQALKYLEILVREPWSVAIPRGSRDMRGPGELSILVANPVTFMLQKLLVLDRRTPQDKDVLYIFDTLQLFTTELSVLTSTFASVRGAIDSQALALFNERRLRLFGRITDPVAGAARIAARTGRPSPPSPDRIREVCSFALDAIFGPSSS